MLRNARASRRCTYGCCGTRLTNKILRAREKKAWIYDQKENSA